MRRHHFRMQTSHTYHRIRPPLRRVPSARTSELMKTNPEKAALYRSDKAPSSAPKQ